MVMNNNSETYQKNGWVIDPSIYIALTDYEKSFVELELGTYKTIDFYTSRLNCLGFSGLNTVLDAGCGIGQWSIALSQLNNKVQAIDLMGTRINFAKALASHMKRDNVEFAVGNLEKLPYKNESFDAIFCYGVFMFTHTKKTLDEFYRILKPEGKLYFNFNSLGWYAHLIIDRGFRQGNFKIIRQALRMWFRYFIGYKSQILIREHWIKKLLEETGFKNFFFASEGCLTPHLQINQEKPKSIYPSHHYGMRSIIEAIVTK